MLAGRTDAIDCLVDLGADVDFETSGAMSTTALCAAAEFDQLRCVQQLVRRGVSIDRATRTGETALTRAAAAGHVEVIKQLVAGGADPDHETVMGITAVGRCRLTSG